MKNYTRPDYNVYKEIDVTDEVKDLVSHKMEHVLRVAQANYDLQVIEHRIRGLQIGHELPQEFGFILNTDGSIKSYVEVLDSETWKATQNKEANEIINNLIQK